MTGEVFDPDAERKFVRAVLADRGEVMERFGERLRCVRAILERRNAKLGEPLGREDLEDVIQDTLLLVFRRLPSYQPHAPLEAWIYGVCCLELRNAVRRKSRTRAPAPLEEEIPDPRLPGAAAELGARDRIRAALDAVGGLEAEIIGLKHLEGLTFDEVGRRLGASANTIKSRYYRGMTRLKRRLETGGGEPR